MAMRATAGRWPAMAGLAFGLVLAVAGAAPARADGGGGNDSGSNRQTCPGGYVYDNRSQQCVQAHAGVLPDKALADYAYTLAKAERYAEALQVLDLMQQPNTAEGLNYRGYATRKLGKLDEGIGYYLRSVKLDPRYAQVREYLGEAYVQKGDLVRARKQLRVIKSLCGTECEEYEDLAKALSGARS